MRALYYIGTQQSEMRDAPEPEVGENQSLIEISHCGICGSDMHAWHGHDARRVPPLVLGHEVTGIAKSGPMEGKRVVLNPLMTCGDCAACQNGREHLCENRELIGMRVPGAFAERIAINNQNIYPIPDHLSFEEGALTEPLACGVHTVRLGLKALDVDPKHTRAVVLGGGAIGLLCAMVLQARGVTDLWLAEMNPMRQEILRTVLNAKIYNPMSEDDEKPDSPDLIVDAVGSGRTREAASAMVRPGGVIAHIGLQDSAEGFDTRRATLQEITFIGTYCYTNADFQTAIDMLADGTISGKGWAEIRSLEEGVQGFEDIHNGVAPPKIILKI